MRLAELNKFNNTGARMLKSIYHMRLKSHSLCENCKILPSFTQCYNGCHYVTLLNLENHVWFIDFIAWFYITPGRDVV